MSSTTLERILLLAERKDRFTYDLRGECLVYNGIVAAYRAAQNSDHFTELAAVIAHALAHDGIIGAWRDPRTQVRYYDSCRLFTDADNAFAFARREGQRAVYNLNREMELSVPGGTLAA